MPFDPVSVGRPAHRHQHHTQQDCKYNDPDVREIIASQDGHGRYREPQPGSQSRYSQRQYAPVIKAIGAEEENNGWYQYREAISRTECLILKLQVTFKGKKSGAPQKQGVFRKLVWIFDLGTGVRESVFIGMVKADNGDAGNRADNSLMTDCVNVFIDDYANTTTEKNDSEVQYGPKFPVDGKWFFGFKFFNNRTLRAGNDATVCQCSKDRWCVHAERNEGKVKVATLGKVCYLTRLSFICRIILG